MIMRVVHIPASSLEHFSRLCLSPPPTYSPLRAFSFCRWKRVRNDAGFLLLFLRHFGSAKLENGRVGCVVWSPRHFHYLLATAEPALWPDSQAAACSPSLLTLLPHYFAGIILVLQNQIVLHSDWHLNLAGFWWKLSYHINHQKTVFGDWLITTDTEKISQLTQ